MTPPCTNSLRLSIDKVVVRAVKGTAVGDAVGDAIMLAILEGRLVAMEFNGKWYRIDPADVVRSIVEGPTFDDESEITP